MKRFISILMAALLVLALPAAAMAAGYEDAKNSVVRIIVEVYEEIVDTSGNPIQSDYLGFMTGSGFAVGKAGKDVKYFVTNDHVVPEDIVEEVSFQYTDGTVVNAYRITKYQPYIVFGAEATKVDADLTARSNRCDLAVLSIKEATDLREAAILRPFEDDTLGNGTVYALGFPYISTLSDNSGTVQYDAYAKDVIVTGGNINRVIPHEEFQEGQAILHTANITSGNSGGPLVDVDGRVVGVNFGAYVADPNYCLAVSSNELVRFLNEEGIDYATSDNTLLIIIIIAAAAVLVIGGVILIVVLTKGGSKVRVMVGVDGALARQNFNIKKGQKVNIGRDTRRCQIVLPDDAACVSNLHCSVSFDGRNFFVTDENSSYGTWIDQNKLVPSTPTQMHRGQTLYLGSKKQSIKLHS